jgi:hypothetical protein
MTRSEQGNQNIVRNLRFRWKKELEHLSDEELLKEYEDFGFSDMSGDNDARFLEWLGIDKKEGQTGP